MARTMKRWGRTWRERAASRAKAMAKRENKFPCHCRRCGYKWKAKRKAPKFCSRCKSASWSKPTVKAIPKGQRVRYWDARVKYGSHGHHLKRGKPVRKESPSAKEAAA